MDAAIKVILNLITYLLKPDNMSKIITAALRIVTKLADGLVKAIPELVKGVAELIMTIGDTLAHNDWGSFGTNIVNGLLEGLTRTWNDLTNWWGNSWNGLVDSAKSWLGIASPSKVFKKIGEFTAEGFGNGWKDEIGDVKDEMEDDLNFDANISTVPTLSKEQTNGKTVSVILNIENFINNTDKDIETLADMLMDAISEKTERAGAVYA